MARSSACWPGTLAAALHHGLTLPAGATVGVKGGWLVGGHVVHTYPVDMAQNFWAAIYAWTACFVVTIVVSLATPRNKTDDELRGLGVFADPARQRARCAVVQTARVAGRGRAGRGGHPERDLLVTENDNMQLDVRLPIGVMFFIIGVILSVYGLITWSDAAMYERSLGYNVNFWWGLFLAAFGAARCCSWRVRAGWQRGRAGRFWLTGSGKVNSLWLIIVALAAFAVAYRFYGAFLAAKVAVLNDNNPTPAYRLRDGVDYHPTKRIVLFGHHFAAIAGPGPLIGPVLAAQWGYFPGFAWIVIGACLAGGVHDFITLVASVRQDGLSLPKLARKMVGPVAGATTAIATLFIIVAVLASVAMVVVKALSHSSWGMFTIIVTVPAALLTGLWMYKIRPGRVGEASVIGVTIVMLGVIFGKTFADSTLGSSLVFSEKTLSVVLPVYAAIASILPVWVLMCPRDYLSSYMKIGVIAVLAVGIFVAQPKLQMPATTPFLSGGGPVVSGAVWPFISHRGHVRSAVRLPRPDRLGHDSEDDQQGVRHAVDRLRRDDPGGLRGADGAGRRVRARTGRLFQDQRGQGQVRELRRRRAAKYEWDLAPVEFDAAGTRHARGAGRADRRRGDAGGGHGQGLLQPPGHEPAHVVLVPLRDHVRGPVHSDAARDGHTRGSVRVPGDAGAIQPGNAASAISPIGV